MLREIRTSIGINHHPDPHHSPDQSLKSPLVENDSLMSDFEPPTNIIVKISFFMLVYTLIGTIFFYSMSPVFCFLDALYFSIITLTTVGYGDLVPKNDVNRIVCMVYASIGVTFFGYVLAMFGQHVVEKQQTHLNSVRQCKSNLIIDQLMEKGIDENSQESETIVRNILKVLLYRLPLIMLIGVFGIIIGRVEKWGVIASLYYSCMTATTIGYGDFHPETRAMKTLAIFFIPISIGIVGETLGAVADAIIKAETDKYEAQHLQKELTEGDLYRMGSERVSKSDFTIFMLRAMNKVDGETLKRISNAFHNLDKDGNGYLEKEDVVGKTKQLNMHHFEL